MAFSPQQHSLARFDETLIGICADISHLGLVLPSKSAGQQFAAASVSGDLPDVELVVDQNFFIVFCPRGRPVRRRCTGAIVIFADEFGFELRGQVCDLALWDRDQVPVLAVEIDRVTATWRPAQAPLRSFVKQTTRTVGSVYQVIIAKARIVIGSNAIFAVIGADRPLAVRAWVDALERCVSKLDKFLVSNVPNSTIRTVTVGINANLLLGLNIIVLPVP